MIGQRYRDKKIAVLAVWRRYRSFRGNSEDGADPAFLELRAKAVEVGRHVLAVVGETRTPRTCGTRAEEPRRGVSGEETSGGHADSFPERRSCGE